MKKKRRWAGPSSECNGGMPGKEGDELMLAMRWVGWLCRGQGKTRQFAPTYINNKTQAEWGYIRNGATAHMGPPRRPEVEAKARRGVNQGRGSGSTMRNKMDPAKLIGLCLQWRPDRKRGKRMAPRSISEPVRWSELGFCRVARVVCEGE